jgi:hypothetical protein
MALYLVVVVPESRSVSIIAQTAINKMKMIGVLSAYGLT